MQHGRGQEMRVDLDKRKMVKETISQENVFGLLTKSTFQVY